MRIGERQPRNQTLNFTGQNRLGHLGRRRLQRILWSNLVTIVAAPPLDAPGTIAASCVK
ncbi:unnamed protein product [Tuwongella immobilis]|uniref:Uncharacterized protein n=1 Tax=Tuwongella immobilis TaxID=692036 RepID=A0A6C2YH82_9BACT|nr:unnamed protein product [Tuwongella immobilis]VTR96620.1 unnamed protein product [Tuwongella immobilis]